MPKIDTQSYKTRAASSQMITKSWWVLDVTNLVVGRCATKIATYIRGKHKPYFSPHMDCGDVVIVVNAGKVRFTGKKMDNKIYSSYSGYPGGQKSITPKQLKAKHPSRIMELAIKRMLPKNKLSSQIYSKNLFVYADAMHPHAAQKPQKMTLTSL